MSVLFRFGLIVGLVLFVNSHCLAFQSGSRGGGGAASSAGSAVPSPRPFVWHTLFFCSAKFHSGTKFVRIPISIAFFSTAIRYWGRL